MNVLLASVLLVALAPVLLCVALLVKLTSSGPALFTQDRVGVNRRNGHRRPERGRRRVDYGGRLFRIYKFRTMYANGTGRDDEVWAQPDDPRVTPVGRVLRKYRLDELPQLWNVLRGDMDLVGPRPEQPRIFLRLREQIDGYEDRQQVRPGITGWAQINQHYDRCIEDVRSKLRLDLEYVQRQSVREDLRILVRTVPVVLLRRGAW